MGSTDDWFQSDGTGVNNSFGAIGSGEYGFSNSFSWPDPPTFAYGAYLVGTRYGVEGDAGPMPSEFAPIATNYADPAGVLGASVVYTGTAGISTLGAGVYGHKSLPGEDIRSIPLAHFAGVVGTGIGWPGVFGWSTSWHGVEGMTYSGEAAVIGRAELGRGVFGISGSQGPDVPNTIDSVAGVIGTSGERLGVLGTSTNEAGVAGYSKNVVGVYGESGGTGPSAYAGYFRGNVHVAGTFTSPNPKLAVVPFPDGTHRALYCMESPEVWFEDFSTAKLRRGRAVVKIDADFAKVIKSDDYRVFVTPEGDCRGLYVHRKSAASFEVRELMGGKSSVAFSYRIVGRRKDIRDQKRFAKIDTRLPLPAVPPSKPTAAGLRAFVARVESEARRRAPKIAIAKKGRRSRKLPKLAARHRIVRRANTQ